MSTLVGVADLGTYSTKVIIADSGDRGKINIKGIGKSSLGLTNTRKPTDKPAKTAKALRVAMKRANEMACSQVNAICVGIGGNFIGFQRKNTTVSIRHEDNIIQNEDIDRLIELAREDGGPSGKNIVSATPYSYTVDGQGGVSDPVGMYGKRLDATIELATAPKTIVKDYESTARQAGLQIDNLIPNPTAIRNLFRDRLNTRSNQIVIDLGHNSSKLAIFENCALSKHQTLPAGGKNLTGDLAAKLNIDGDQAEKIKHELSINDKSGVEKLKYTNYAGKTSKIESSEVRKVLTSRLKEIFDMLLSEIKDSGYSEILNNGVTIIGGVGNTSGLIDWLNRKYQENFKLGLVSSKITGLEDIISNPAYTVSLSLLLEATSCRKTTSEQRSKNTTIETRFQTIRDKVQKLFTNVLEG